MAFPAGRTDLYLTEIGEPSDNVLRVVVLEARDRGEAVETEVGPARRMAFGATSRAFELIWESYVAYAVRDESHARLEDGETRSGDSLYTRDRSAFLNYVGRATSATDAHPGPITHWTLDTLNHSLDVVAVEGPSVRVMARSEVGREPNFISWERVSG